MLTLSNASKPRPLASAAALLLGLSLLAGCQTNQSTVSLEGIDFREARYAEISALREFRACRDEALEMDVRARESGDPARYLVSARLMEGCDANLGPEAQNISTEERMRAYGLTIQNYLKGGDAAGARHNLARFEQAFPANDLYYPDGASFRETMSTLLGQRDQKGFGQFALLNVSGGLKDEMRRISYWKSN